MIGLTGLDTAQDVRDVLHHKVSQDPRRPCEVENSGDLRCLCGNSVCRWLGVRARGRAVEEVAEEAAEPAARFIVDGRGVATDTLAPSSPPKWATQEQAHLWAHIP